MEGHFIRGAVMENIEGNVRRRGKGMTIQGARTMNRCMTGIVLMLLIAAVGLVFAGCKTPDKNLPQEADASDAEGTIPGDASGGAADTGQSMGLPGSGGQGAGSGQETGRGQGPEGADKSGEASAGASGGDAGNQQSSETGSNAHTQPNGSQEGATGGTGQSNSDAHENDKPDKESMDAFNGTLERINRHRASIAQRLEAASTGFKVDGVDPQLSKVEENIGEADKYVESAKRSSNIGELEKAEAALNNADKALDERAMQQRKAQEAQAEEMMKARVAAEAARDKAADARQASGITDDSADGGEHGDVPQSGDDNTGSTQGSENGGKQGNGGVDTDDKWKHAVTKFEEAGRNEANPALAMRLYKEAEALFNDAAKEAAAGGTEQLLEEAKTANRAGMYARATELALRVLSLDPGNKGADLLLSQIPQVPDDCEWIAEKGTKNDGKKETYFWNNRTYPMAIRHKASGIEFVLILPGEFVMGSPEEEEGRDVDEVPHTVKITKPFYLGRTEVTQEQYKKVTGQASSRFAGDRLPVEKISWHDASAFCAKLGASYCLPTEAQWEYACRAAGKAPWHFGDKAESLNDYCWYDGNSEGKTHEVGTKKPNAWGLYDMHGNVWEWCEDWYGDYSADPAEDPVGAESGEKKILRGGSWCNSAGNTRCAYRYRNTPFTKVDFNGFRVCLKIE